MRAEDTALKAKATGQFLAAKVIDGVLGGLNLLVAPMAVLGVLSAAGAFGQTRADCLTDDELGAVTRSVFTKSLGPTMRICAKNHPDLEPRVLDATRDFFVTYAKEMRRNRLKTNEIFKRVFAAEWEDNLQALLAEATAPGERRARKFNADQCLVEIKRLEVMVNRLDYSTIMTEGPARKLFEFERKHIPVCGK
ncbi:MAG: hypothetical protein CMM10_11085 [Rhodospirillaceae bacterium]|nr:hypothetical protein [Rhodospirillaceae bacterium]